MIQIFPTGETAPLHRRAIGGRFSVYLAMRSVPRTEPDQWGASQIKYSEIQSFTYAQASETAESGTRGSD